MRVAITGVSGYLGRLIVRQMDADPAVDTVLGLDRVSPEFESPKLRFQVADVRSADFTSHFRDVQAVYICAFIVDPPRRVPMTVIDDINIRGSMRVLLAAVRAGVSKIIHASSITAYGVHADNPPVLLETSPLRPNINWYYSRAKGRIEFFLDALETKRPEIRVIRFRPCIFLGPEIDNIIGKALKGRILFCLDRRHRLDLCWGEDVARAFARALHYDHSGIFNLAADGPVTVAEAGALVGKRVVQLPRRSTLLLAEAAARLGVIPAGYVEWARTYFSAPTVVSAARARERLGWRPRYSAAEALQRFCGDPPKP